MRGEGAEALHGPEEPGVEWFLLGTIDRRKFDEYLLSPSHPTGKHKARLWGAVFGVREGGGELLASLIMEQLPQAEEVRERPPKPDAENPGRLTRRFTLDIPRFRGPNGNVARLRTNWALSPEREVPHLASAFPKPES